MKRFKKIMSVSIAAVFSFCLAIEGMVSAASSSLYNSSDNTLDNIENYYVIGLEGDPISCNQSAREMGVMDFILTDEGKTEFQEIMAQHESVKKQISHILGKELDIKYDYTAAYNGFSMAASLNEIEKIQNASEELGITYISFGSLLSSNSQADKTETKKSGKSLSYTDFTNAIFEKTGITQSGLDGKGTVIAVIDNEMDYSHEFLQPSPGFSGKLSKDDIKSVSPYLTSSPYISDKCYYNEKIPYIFNYNKRSYNTDSVIDTSDSHGTHVAGIIAGNVKNVSLSQYTPKGVAPEAQLILMSTFNFYSDELLAAYDDVLYIGADVVNASYGVASVTTNVCEAEKTAINNITASGTIFCAAAGNDAKYPIISNMFTDYSTGGQPDNLNSTLSIGSADNIIYESSNSSVMLSDGSEELVCNASPIGIAEQLNDLTYEYVPISGYGAEEDFEELDLTGKIALIKRGEITFADKIANAHMANAEGVLIYNNNNSGIIEIESADIPAGMISMEAGEKMLKLSDKTITFINGTPTIEIDEITNMSDFSSWDFTEQLLLKPDISGFGGNILSSVADKNHTHKSYNIYSGTSMAAPQITGISALLLQHIKNNPEKYVIANRSEYPELAAKLLMSTATPIYTSDDMEIASPRVQGNGLANIESAINTPCYISTDSEKDVCRPKLSLGDGYKKNYTLGFNVTNLSDNDTEYNLSLNLFKDEADENGDLAWNTAALSEGTDYSVTYKNQKGNKITKVTIPAGKTVKLSANITLSDGIYNKIMQDGGRFVDGFVRLTSLENPNLTLSFMAFCGNWADAGTDGVIFDFAYQNPDAEYASLLCDSSENISGVNLFDYSISEPAFSPSETQGDNVFDDIMLNLYFKRRCYDITAKIYNSDNKMIYEEYLGNSGDRTFYYDPGLMQSGNYYNVNWDFKENGVIKNNEEYTIEVSAVMPLSEESTVIGSQKFTIDTQKPVIKNVGVIDIFGTEYLVIDAQDNNQLQGALNHVESTDTILDFASANSSATEGRLIIESDRSKFGGEVEVYDTAGNYTTVNINDAKYSLAVQTENGFGYAATDDEDFFSGRIHAYDENGKNVNLDFSGSITPQDAYEYYGTSDVDVSFLIEGHEVGTFTVNAGIRGDANLDGVCNVRDAAYIAQKLSRRSDDRYYTFISSLGGYLADFNHDNQTSVRDAAAIARYLVSKK